ncbi:MAG: hypothetical protein H0V48_07780 [Nocardioidaceae bacterium]|nr:hypothetical protein [Nocardioidaceae bacterium]
MTCTARAGGCDADHTPEWPQGRTRAADLIDGCRHHHLAATFAGFSREQVEPGVVAWTTPTGHGYRVEAEPVPVETWWPPQPRTRCPCDHCDTPLNEDSDILAALPPGDTLDDLTAADLEHVTAA